MTETPLARFTLALSAARTRAVAIEALGAYAEATVAVRLFTITTLDYTAKLHRRNYSNMPEVYPVSGDKPLTMDNWSAQVLDRRENYIANTIADMGPAFPDAALIASVGCGSVLNMPVILRGQVVATLNLLDREGFFDAATVARCEAALGLPAMACFLIPE